MSDRRNSMNVGATGCPSVLKNWLVLQEEQEPYTICIARDPFTEPETMPYSDNCIVSCALPGRTERVNVKILKTVPTKGFARSQVYSSILEGPAFAASCQATQEWRSKLNQSAEAMNRDAEKLILQTIGTHVVPAEANDLSISQMVTQYFPQDDPDDQPLTDEGGLQHTQSESPETILGETFPQSAANDCLDQQMEENVMEVENGNAEGQSDVIPSTGSQEKDKDISVLMNVGDSQNIDAMLKNSANADQFLDDFSLVDVETFDMEEEATGGKPSSLDQRFEQNFDEMPQLFPMSANANVDFSTNIYADPVPGPVVAAQPAVSTPKVKPSVLQSAKKTKSDLHVPPDTELAQWARDCNAIRFTELLDNGEQVTADLQFNLVLRFELFGKNRDVYLLEIDELPPIEKQVKAKLAFIDEAVGRYFPQVELKKHHMNFKRYLKLEREKKYLGMEDEHGKRPVAVEKFVPPTEAEVIDLLPRCHAISKLLDMSVVQPFFMELRKLVFKDDWLEFSSMLEITCPGAMSWIWKQIRSRFNKEYVANGAAAALRAFLNRVRYAEDQEAVYSSAPRAKDAQAACLKNTPKRVPVHLSVPPMRMNSPTSAEHDHLTRSKTRGQPGGAGDLPRQGPTQLLSPAEVEECARRSRDTVPGKKKNARPDTQFFSTLYAKMDPTLGANVDLTIRRERFAWALNEVQARFPKNSDKERRTQKLLCRGLLDKKRRRLMARQCNLVATVKKE